MNEFWSDILPQPNNVLPTEIQKFLRGKVLNWKRFLLISRAKTEMTLQGKLCYLKSFSALLITQQEILLI